MAPFAGEAARAGKYRLERSARRRRARRPGADPAGRGRFLYGL